MSANAAQPIHALTRKRCDPHRRTRVLGGSCHYRQGFLHFKQAWSWEDWLPYLLGEPHVQRSSLFVNQETGMAMKKVYQSLVLARFFEA